MATSKDYLAFVLDQLSGLSEISPRAMMGEYVLYYCGKVIGGIYDDRLLLKLTKAAEAIMPDAVDVAIPRKAKISTQPAWPQMNVHHYTDDRHELGVTTVKEGKNEFQIYDMEKTVVDIVFYREKVGIEETKEILVTYLQRKDRNLNRLLKYAELMKCDKTMRQYLEVLI